MKRLSMMLGLTCILSTNLPTVRAEFDFCSGSSSGGGSGTFQQQILHDAIVMVGEIPKNIEGLSIQLQSDKDVDVQLYDGEDGTPIVKWAYYSNEAGILYDCCKDSTNYQGMAIEWSGYNGDGTGSGNEYINITGQTTRQLVMKAYGYQAGFATVDYSWSGGQSSDCQIPETGGDSFQQQILKDDIIKVGDIPPGVNNLYIKLVSDKDVDIQLYDKDDGTAIVKWAYYSDEAGILYDCCKDSTNYQGMTIEWSGYNGDGTGVGHEYIKITGNTTRNLTMKAYGYQAGYAVVEYSWGNEEAHDEELHGSAPSILEDPEQESYNPTIISGSYQTSLQTGANYFKFEVEPGYDYSFIVNTNNYEHLLQSKSAAYSVHYSNSGYQSEVNGVPLSNHGISGNDSHAKSAIIFEADPSYYSEKYYNYVQIYILGNDDVSIAHIRLVKKSNKQFGLPINGLHAYYNAFGHRAEIKGGTYLTNNGHDGIDIQAYYVSGGEIHVDFDQPIVPVAEGCVVKTASLGGNLGEAVWIHHTLNGQAYTSLYAHLQNLQVSKGDCVTKGATALGYIHTEQKHIHLEIFKDYIERWYDGYSYGNGQVDPLGQIFVK